MAVVTKLQLKRSLRSASSYQEWFDAAQAYDRYTRQDLWRRKDYSSQYVAHGVPPVHLVPPYFKSTSFLTETEPCDSRRQK